MAGHEDELVGKWLVAQGAVTQSQINAALDGTRPILEELVNRGFCGTERINEALAAQFGMECAEDLLTGTLPLEILEKVPYLFVKKHLAFPYAAKGDEVFVAIYDPLNLDAVDELQLMLGKTCIAQYAPKEEIALAVQARYDQTGGEASELIAGLSRQKDESQVQVYDLLDKTREQSPIVKVLNVILLEAIQQGASDIHFEPSEGDLRVRYRIDGVLQNRHSPSHEYQAQLLTRVKVMAELDIAERRLPQDGRIKLRLGNREIDFRVSTVPVACGERIVLRVLDKGNIVLGLAQIGMPDYILKEFRDLITLPEGILLVTGPTGSGKTTTLYSSIHEVASDEINVMTIEDPVEYKLAGIAQIGVRPKIDLTFAKGLRHILRQDPDVVMVGEIRDRETAEIAIQASLTGHLVLSTLHTNDAPSAVARLVDMGIESYLLSSTIVGVLAQRLVRTICPDCKEERPPAKGDERFGAETLWTGRGCDSCYGTGYRGRHGIYELMRVTEDIRQNILDSPDAVRLRHTAIDGGMRTLLDHGKELVRDGITTVEELLRVVRE
jgi:general secretion pathway protein E